MRSAQPNSTKRKRHVSQSESDMCVTVESAHNALPVEMLRKLHRDGYVCVPLKAKHVTHAEAIETYTNATREAIQLFLDWRFQSAASSAVPLLSDPTSFRLLFRPPFQVPAAAYYSPFLDGGGQKTVIGYKSGQLQLFQLHLGMRTVLVQLAQPNVTRFKIC